VSIQKSRFFMSLEATRHIADVIKVNAVSLSSLAFAQYLPTFHELNDAIQAAGSTVIILSTAAYSCLKLWKAYKAGKEKHETN